MIEFENLEEVAADLSKKTIHEEIIEFQEQLKQQLVARFSNSQLR